MTDNNKKIAEIFLEIADILETENVEWKPRAYRNAARSLQNLNEDVKDINKRGGLKALEEIPSIGEGLGKKIIEFLETGKINEREKLEKEVPESIETLIKIPGMGPKKAKILVDKLNIKTISDLEKAAEHHDISKLEGFGEKSEQDILDSIAISKISKGKIPYKKAKEIAEKVITHMKKVNPEQITYAGSLRRKKEMIRDIDILVASDKSKLMMDHFVTFPKIKKVIAKGKTKSEIILEDGIQIDLRVFLKEEWGAGLLYFTGSKNHNIYLRKVAIAKNLKLNEYGVFNKKGKCLASKTEEDMFKSLGLNYIPPEKRET